MSELLSLRFIKEWQEQFPFLQRAMKSNSLFCFGHKRGKARVENLLISFSSALLVFCERKSERVICSWKRVNCSRRSFFISNLSKSLTVALLSWSTWANCSFVMNNLSESLTVAILSREWLLFPGFGIFSFAHSLFALLLKIAHFKERPWAILSKKSKS